MLPRLEIERPKSLSVIVEERLRDAIINAELSFGQPLPEDGTGLALGVSRTPMREALTRLEAQGLVVIVPKKGAFVFEPSLADVRQLADFRLMLEVAAIEQCLVTDPRGTLVAMRRAIAMMGASREIGDTQAYARADTAFHDAFFANCGNVYLVSAYRAVSGRIAALRAHLSVPRASEQDTSYQEHRAIAEAFAAGDAAVLKQILRDHILRARAVYAAAFDPVTADPA